jgi:hypothetical protein
MPSGLMLPLPCPTIDGERPKRNSVIALVSCDNVPPLQLAPLTAQLDQAHFMMICSVRTHRQRQAMAIHYRHDFHAFSTLVGPISAPPPLAIAKVAR